MTVCNVQSNNGFPGARNSSYKADRFLSTRARILDDLVDGFILAGTRPEAVGEVFTIGGERYTTLRELVDTIAEVLGKPRPFLRVPFKPVYAASVLCDAICRPLGISPPLYPRRVEFFSKSRAFSIEKAQRMLGYAPKVGLREGLARTAAWYRQEGLIAS